MTGSELNHQRFTKVKAAKIKVKDQANDAAAKLEQTQGPDAVGENPWIDFKRAETRKHVSELLFAEDSALPAEEQEQIKARQINKYYRYKVSRPDLRGHVEAQHGARIKDAKMRLYCIKNGYTSYEVYTGRIAEQTANNMVFKKPRLHTDINNLPSEVQTSLQSERACYTREYNLNGVKAERDLTGRILQSIDNLDENGKAKNPHLHIMLHGKTDKRGHDFEIAAKAVNGQTPLDPRLAFWIADKIKEKTAQKGIKNDKDKQPSVNVVAYGGAYSGSPSLRRLRHGDDVLNFKGFGEMLQVLQLECGTYLRQYHSYKIAEILNELIEDFSNEFKTADDFKKLNKYSTAVADKIKEEIENLFKKDNIMFADKYPESAIGLSKTLRDELGVENDNTVVINGKEFTVKGMLTSDLKTGKTIKLHVSHETSIGEKIVITKSKETI